MTNDTWGPWVEHDGKGCPVRGQYMQLVELCAGRGELPVKELIAASEGGLSWSWSNAPEYTSVIRYRVRKPRAMERLNALLREVEDNPKVELVDG